MSIFIADLITASRPKLQVAAKYALVEMTPPKIGDIPAIRQGKIEQNESNALN